MSTLTSLTLVALLAGGHDSSVPNVAELRAHYAAVGAELSAASVEHLDLARRLRRSSMLTALEAYAARGDFGRGPADGDLRALAFVDDDGRRCAVAELLHVSGREALVERVRLGNNDAFVQELEGDAAFLRWLDEVGLTFAEAARIQAPVLGGQPSDVGGPASPAPAPGRPASPPWGGPGGGAGPGTGGPVGPVGPLGPATGGAAPAGPSAPVGGPGSAAFGELLAQDWWTWWEFAKADLLSATTEVARPVSDGDGSRTADERERLVLAALPVLEAALADADPGVRAAGAVAFGRLAGVRAVRPLTELLDDPSLAVREAALVALGATGTERAGHLLLSIAHGRAVDGYEPWATGDELAVLALGILRARGGGSGVDGMLPDGAPRADEAAFLHSALAPSARFESLVRERSGAFGRERVRKFDRDGTWVDVLAVEALRDVEGEDVLAGLLAASAERDLERRRSAYATLGALGDVRADGPLRTAYELEKDPGARGLTLVALARTMGDGVDEFLAKALRRGRAIDRPWAALALGLLAREVPSDVALVALRETLVESDDRDTRRAVALGLGLARDVASVPTLLERLRETGDSGTRVALGYALGLVGDPAAAEALRAAARAEGAAIARAELLQGLAALGLEQDVDVLVAELGGAGDAQVGTQLAAAVAFHGSLRAVPGLVRQLDGEPASARAAKLEALGLLLDADGRFALATELVDRNPHVLPAWFLRSVQTTL